MKPIIPRQINWLRQLSIASRDEIKVMLQPATTWIELFDVIQHVPLRPIHSRTILRNELIFEIDNDNWNVVRDGTRDILTYLKQWGAKDSYYLSYSGNRSIHVHVFTDWTSVEIAEDTAELINGHDDVLSSMKAYWTRQFNLATGASLDTQLTGRHLIRMEGGFNEKSRKFCTMIDDIPEDKPQYYEITIPDRLPPSTWNLSRFTIEINSFLRIHYKSKPVFQYNQGKPFNPEPLIDILRPVYIPGHRHMLVLCIAGWLKRHGITETDALRIIKEINPHDKTQENPKHTVHDIFTAPETARIPGLPKLISVIRDEITHGEISHVVGEDAINALNMIMTEEVIYNANPS
ncbi:MAG: hypothetical protein ACYDAP_05940 [Thermoplasmataceae archaeon]